MAIRITCVNKANGQHENPHVAISDLGWIADSTGQAGKNSRLEIYDFLKNKGGQAYVQDSAGNRAIVVPRETQRGTKYVQTVKDNTPTDNLLSLMECR